MLALLLLFVYSFAQPLDCLGTGIDATKLIPQCLAKIYHPTNDQIFRTDIFESHFSQLSIVMQSHFDIDAYYHDFTSSSDFFGFGSSSTEVYRYYQNYYNQNKSLTKIILSISFTKWTAPVIFSDYVLDKYFVTMLDSLPEYHENDTIYTEFINTWGTDVLYEITTGGKFETNLWYDNMINKYYNEEKISEYSGWSFAGIIGNGHGTSNTNIHVDKVFNALMHMQYMYLGGNISMLPNQYLDWAKTVENNTQIIKYEMIPITFFVKNKTVSSYLKQAIYDYGKRSKDNLNKYISSLKN